MNTIIVVMGVSGTGKSTIALELAQALNFQYIDADDYHDQTAKIMMSQGTAITDVMRDNWMQRLSQDLTVKSQSTAIVLAFSGLKKDHRNIIRSIEAKKVMLFLDGSFELVYERMLSRENHFFPAQLLKSQFRSLEHPRLSHLNEDEQDITLINIDGSVDDCIEHALIAIKNRS